MTGELGRLEALRLAGLTAAADPGMDRFARLVARLLDVPTALVSILETDRQVFPGMVGLEEPWASMRATPLDRSYCQHVVDSGEPLILTDTRAHPLTCASLAISELQVIGYAGMPLADADDHVLGSLCAIDHRPHEWTEDELRDLADLSAACSVELRLRIAGEQLQSDRDHADLLLRASVELARSSGMTDVLRRLRHLYEGPSQPCYVGLLLAKGTGLHRVVDANDVRPTEQSLAALPLDSDFPSARTMREQRAVFVPDHATLAADYSAEAVAGYDELGLDSVFCVPLAHHRGVLSWCWGEPHVLGVTEEAVLTAVAGYVSQALERTLFVENRLSTAEQLQAAMLTELPDVRGLEMATLYLPAADQDMVGGDWYDAYVLPPGEDGHSTCLMVSIGDIIGHDMHAATVMGQVRSMLRQATLGHPERSPAAALKAVEAAFSSLPLGPGGTAVHARLDPDADGWRLTWSNAGHPPPLVRTPDGRVRTLGEHDLLLLDTDSGLGRHESECVIAPGSVLLLYTDGLVEHRDSDIDAGIHEAVSLLSAYGDHPLPELLEALSRRAKGSSQHDDIAVLAVRVTETDGKSR